MCGIAGFFAPGTAENEGSHHLRRMLRAIEHRGPDSQGSWSNGPLGLHLGMRRLSIIDIAGGEQPLWNEDRNVAVFFNGEIYNYIELRRDLEAAGHVFISRSDTEVLAHLYERDGEKMFSALRGMFAIAIHDLRKKSLLLARDPTGQKPLFYYRDERRFAFASEIKSLLTLPFVPDEMDSTAFLDYLTWLSLPAPATHFKYIQKLPPASFLSIDLNKVGAATVRSFAPSPDDALPLLSDPDEAAAALDAALQQSAAIHLRSDVPVGVLLSSGIDSQTVASYVQSTVPDQICSFTAVFTEGSSEQEGAEANARLVKSNHFNIPLTSADLGCDIEQVAWFLDEPVGDPAAFAVHKVCQFARSHVKVVLSGEGSDELFAGYSGRYRGIIETLERSNRIRSWAGWLPPIPVPSTRTAAGRWLRRAQLSEAQEAVLLRAEGFPGDIRTPLNLVSSHQQLVEKRAAHYAPLVCQKRSSLLETLLQLDRTWQLAESLLVKADRMSMAASIELRTPFLDPEIIKLSRRMSPGLKLPAGGPGKWILYKCLERRFPKLQHRKKLGFPIPLDVWLHRALRPQVEESLLGLNSSLKGLLDPQLLHSAWNAFLDGRCPALFIYSLWLYETWRREFPRRVQALKSDR